VSLFRAKTVKTMQIGDNKMELLLSRQLRHLISCCIIIIIIIIIRVGESVRTAAELSDSQ